MMPDSICTQSLYKQDCPAVHCGMFVQCIVVQSLIAIAGMLSAMTRPHIDPSSGLQVFFRGGIVLIKQTNQGTNKHIK